MTVPKVVQSHLHRLIVKLDSFCKVEITQDEIYSGNINNDGRC